MNRGVSPFGVSFTGNKINKSVAKAVKNPIDAYYEKELKSIRKQKIDKDVFIKLDPNIRMESVKNKIQISIENMRTKKD